MPDMPTLLDVAKLNGTDATVGLIDEASRVHPEIARIATRTIKGISFPTRVRIANPTAGFRNANQGVDYVKGRYENRVVSTYILNPRWGCDKAVADAYEDGAEAFIAMEGTGIVNAAYATVASQIYYKNDAAGYPSLAEAVKPEMVLDAGGTTAATGSSVWALSYGVQGVQFVVGNGGELDLSEVRIESIDGDNGKPLTGYVQELMSRIGLQVGNLNGVARIKNLTEDADKGLTDDRLAELLTLFPIGNKPDVFFLSRRSLEQLRKSRTATNATGAPAPTPTEYEGIPLVPTDSIVNTEAIS